MTSNNNKVAIVTDSVACIPKEQAEEYGIEVVPIQVVFGDKVYRDGVDITPREFYAMLRNAEKLPTTAAAIPGAVLETYRKASQRADSILCVTISSNYYLAKGGHVPKIMALAGSLIKIKPILTFKEGEAEPIANPRTNSKAIERMLQLMGQRMVKGEPLHVAVTHADVEDEAIKLKDRIASQYNCADLFITEFTPVMGVHTGPGVIGICFFSGN